MASEMCSLKPPSLGPKCKLKRDAGCRLCKTAHGYTPLSLRNGIENPFTFAVQCKLIP